MLNLLQAEFIPGLDADPQGDLTADQQAIALKVAGRALWARELAQLPTGNEWVIHNNLLTAVGSCAYAQSVVSVYHWPAGDAVPRRFFGHVRADDVVTHTRPAEVLHRFSLLHSRDELVDQVLAACNYEPGPAGPGQELALSSADFVALRELAGAGDPAGAADLLVTKGASPETARAFVATLAGSPRVSILQLLKQAAGGEAQQQDVTLLQNDQYAWLIQAAPGDIAAAPLSIKSAGPDEVKALLAGWL